MGRGRSRVRILEVGGLAGVVAGAVLVGTVVTVSASASTGESGCRKGACAIAVSPSSDLTFAQPVIVSGSGFSHSAHGAVMECNLDPVAPTIAIPDDRSDRIENFPALSVGCTDPAGSPIEVSKQGTFSGGFGVEGGQADGANVVGPPAAGTDSSGGSADTDAADYPCPPTPDQVSAGVSCAIVFVDSVGGKKREVHETAYEDIGFSTTATTTSTTGTTTTITTEPCTPIAASATATNHNPPNNTATVTVTPATCLVGEMVTTVSAVNLVPNSLGSMLECNDDPGQPTVTFAGTAIPVGCSPITLMTTTSVGGIPSSAEGFTVITGTVGPPCGPGETESCAAVDSTGGNAAADAADYPCPPTPAQVAAGVSCVIAVGDDGGDQLQVPIAFNPAVPPGG